MGEAVEFRANPFDAVPEQIMPLLAPKYLNFKDMLKCRLFSKRWKDAIDFVLENHPDRLPYQPIPTTPEEALLVTETHHNFQRLPKFRNMTELMHSCERRTQWMNCPEDRNPFVGRTLTFTIAGWESQTDLGRPTPQQLNTQPPAEGLALLERFGSHIWYFELAVFQNSIKELNTKNCVQFLFHCLCCLTNLKSLKVVGTVWNSDDFHDFPRTIFVPAKLAVLDLTGLPRIDTGYHSAYLDYYYEGLLGILFKTFGRGLKKLTMYLGDWEERAENLFPRLTHLAFKCSSYYPRGVHLFARITRAFEQLKNPMLVKKFELIDIEDGEMIDVYTLLNALSPYQIESLEVQSEFIPIPSVYFFGAPPIKMLKIYDKPRSKPHWVFFKQLPLLKFLSVDTTRMDEWRHEFVLRFLRRTFKSDGCLRLEHKVRAYCYYDMTFRSCGHCRIWDELPALERFNVESNSRICRRYVRERKMLVDASVKTPAN